MGSSEPPEPGEDLPLRLAAALTARARDQIAIDGHRSAAVLVPLVFRDGGWRLIFTERSIGLRSHSGQVSFPGGSMDGAETAERAALREAEEEIGLDPGAVRFLGRLDDVPTPTGYVITPVVAVIEPPPAAYRPSAFEVAEVFEVPLSRFAEPGVMETLGAVERWGRRFVLLSYDVQGHKVWGATARMVHDLLGLVTRGPSSLLR